MLAPLYRDKLRLFALDSGSSFGPQTDPEHFMARMDGLVDSFQSPTVFETYQQRSQVEPKVASDNYVAEDFNIKSDVLLKETHRQHMGIDERYRRAQPDLLGVNRISDGPTRYHTSMSRGFEREIIDHLTRLDGEFMSRATIKPILV